MFALERFVRGAISRKEAPIMAKHRTLNDSHFDNFKDKRYEDGVLRLALASWHEFLDVCQIFANNRADYIWRGHQDEDWTLKSYFDRESPSFLPHITDRRDKLAHVLDGFKQWLSELPGMCINGRSEDELWAIGQHYGLPTPLLDWTESPYIAAFMAFRRKDTGSQSGNRVVYALSKVLKTLMRKTKMKEKCKRTGKLISSRTSARDRFIEFLDLSETCDMVQNLRLKAQKGRFTKALDGIRIDDGVSRLVRHRREISEAETVILARIEIPNTERHNCLEWLRKEKEIVHGKLFPDYPGAVEICRDDLGMNRVQAGLTCVVSGIMILNARRTGTNED